ncbi:MAG: alcohol dehydrogenase [Deltaproteobacteria bacterium CG11_big_fil_rev_8_21_14_0_20_47_16]|nr:MAG: alcohol dehydrogenase [Deltaproteobacteria bacterium CG11_big_fil_rev_8_21_14_0_20_47_16]
MDPQRVLITGVSSGLGYALATTYLNMGWKVYGTSRRYPDGLQGNPNLYFNALDLEDLRYIPNALASLLSHVSKLDLVILNAAVICPIADMKDTRVEELQHAMKVNVWANKVILDTLFQREIEVPQVVGISSGASITGLRGWNGYALSKSSLNMLMQLYSQEAPHTHFTALAPGIVDTPLQDYISSVPDTEKFPTITRLQRMKANAEMPSADGVAQKLAHIFPRLLNLPSGSYTDVRKMA